MMNPWISTSRTLPKDGDAVLFVVEQRCLALRGVYSGCTFKSRWSCYSPGDISEWRKIDADMEGPIDAVSKEVDAAKEPTAARAA